MKQAAENLTTLTTQTTLTDCDAAQYDVEIIAALVDPEPGLLNALYRTSTLTKQAVNTRAEQLGLTSDFIKRCRLTGTRPSLRTCVKCDVRFLSAGPQNRLCRRCPPR
jgi:uncharacterized paraquat-inducible protein A